MNDDEGEAVIHEALKGSEVHSFTSFADEREIDDRTMFYDVDQGSGVWFGYYHPDIAAEADTSVAYCRNCYGHVSGVMSELINDKHFLLMNVRLNEKWRKLEADGVAFRTRADINLMHHSSTQATLCARDPMAEVVDEYPCSPLLPKLVVCDGYAMSKSLHCGQCDSAVSDFRRCEHCENLCHHDGPTKCFRSLTMHQDRCEGYRFITSRWCDSCDEEMPDEDNESSSKIPHVCDQQQRNNARAHILILSFLVIMIAIKKYGVE